MIRIGVVGAGHWGPNLIRNFHNRQRSEVRWVVDLNEQRRDAIHSRYPSVETFDSMARAFDSQDVDAVVVATPTVTHYELVKAALEAGKHVLVEKPLTADSKTSQELVDLARSKNLKLLVGHVFLYNSAVRWVKEAIDNGDLGQIYYLSSTRTNLGPIRFDVNAAWDLASQDIAILQHWLGAPAIAASAMGSSWINPNNEDAAFIALRFPNNVLAHLHVSWLNPRKTRDMTVVAANKMLTYDDMNMTEPVRVYNKHVSDDTVQAPFVDTFASFRASIRDGDIHIPHVALGEPLRTECENFLDCVEKHEEPVAGPEIALHVVKTLEAVDRSMKNGGREEEV